MGGLPQCAMGKTAKIVLGVIGVFVLACVVGAVLLGRFAKQKIGGIVEETQRATAEARTFARTHQQGDCMDEGMRRARGCAAFQCMVATQNFTAICLSAAAATPGICDGVPHPQDFMSSSRWINSRCPVTGPTSAPDQASLACRNVVPALQAHCARQSAAAAGQPDASTMMAAPDAAAP